MGLKWQFVPSRLQKVRLSTPFNSHSLHTLAHRRGIESSPPARVRSDVLMPAYAAAPISVTLRLMCPTSPLVFFSLHVPPLDVAAPRSCMGEHVHGPA
jgi:hypothetical protein